VKAKVESDGRLGYKVELRLTSDEISAFLERGRLTLGDGQSVTLTLIEWNPTDQTVAAKLQAALIETTLDAWRTPLLEQIKKPPPISILGGGYC
jgi:hypothetical protein